LHGSSQRDPRALTKVSAGAWLLALAGRGELPGLVLGSTGQPTIRPARCPVLRTCGARRPEES
jgi:hypothetical protein